VRVPSATGEVRIVRAAKAKADSKEAVVSDALAALRLLTFAGVSLTLALVKEIPGTWAFWGVAAAAVPGALHFIAPHLHKKP